MKFLTQKKCIYLFLMLILISRLSAGVFPSVKDFGAVGDGVTDDLPAFNLAIASTVQQGTFVYPTCGIIVVPPGTYYLNGTLTLSSSVHLIGGGAGQSGGNWSSTLKFPADTVGIIVTKGNVNPNQNGGDGTILEGLFLSGGGGSDSTAHGIDMQARIKVKDCSISGFKGNGINLVADINYRTNANCWAIDTVNLVGNGGHGLYVDGGDTNAGVGKSINSSANGGWGIYDSSFLGNTYLGCHTASNVLGAYKSDNANARNIFLGCYAEGGQPASEIASPSMVIGGLFGDVTGSGYFLIDGKTPSISSTLDGGTINIGKSELIGLVDDDHPQWPYRLKYDTGSWYLDWANLAAGVCLELYTRAATPANGYARDMSDSKGGLGLPRGFYGGGMKYRGEAAAAPSTGTWLQGDIIYNLQPIAGGYLGWVCVTGGSPGTWKNFGAIQP